MQSFLNCISELMKTAMGYFIISMDGYSSLAIADCLLSQIRIFHCMIHSSHHLPARPGNAQLSSAVVEHWDMGTRGQEDTRLATNKGPAWNQVFSSLPLSQLDIWG